MEISKEMNILMSTDNNYIRYSMVTIASLFENHRGVKINIFIINSHLDTKYINEISCFVEDHGGKVQIINIDDRIFDGFPVNRHYTVACYYILVAHLYLPQNLDRILYLDGDIIVDKNILEFYYTDFEDNFLIACGHILGDTKELAKKKAKGSGAQGNYFNSGVLIFNLLKFRKEITVDSYLRACNELNNEFFLDQGLLNYMFADKTKYMPMLDYNFRLSVFDDIRGVCDKNGIQYSKSIIHYTLPKPHYKPWELFFNDEEIASIKNKKECLFFNISEEANELIGLWWKYARTLPKNIYRKLYQTMQIQKRFFLKSINSYGNIILTQRNAFAKTYAFEERKKNRIRQFQRDRGLIYLESLALEHSMLKDQVFIDKSLFADNFNEQFLRYEKAKEHLVVLVAARDNISTHWNKIQLDRFHFSLDMSNSFRSAYIAIWDNYHGIIYEKKSKEAIEKDYTLASFDINLFSMGYEPRTMACGGNIYINNFDVSLNMTGLNVVVINLDTLEICDSFSVNMHADASLSIKRII